MSIARIALSRHLAATSLVALLLTHPAAAADEDWIDLIPDKDFTGWQTEGNWKVLDGSVLTLEPRPGEKGWQRFEDYLFTTRKFADFELELEFKFEKHGNSGVFLRVADPADPVQTGFELQILDTHGKKDVGHHDCGGIIRTQGPAKNMVKPAGEWNHYRIVLRGTHLTVALNGEPIQDLDLSQGPMKDRPRAGYLGFQDEAKRVWYRNVRLRELSPEPS